MSDDPTISIPGMEATDLARAASLDGVMPSTPRAVGVALDAITPLPAAAPQAQSSAADPALGPDLAVICRIIEEIRQAREQALAMAEARGDVIRRLDDDLAKMTLERDRMCLELHNLLGRFCHEAYPGYHARSAMISLEEYQRIHALVTLESD